MLDNLHTHIIHIIPTLRYGGAERLVVDMCNSLVQRGYRVSIITFFDDIPLASELDGRVHHEVVPKHNKLGIGLVHALVRLLRDMDATFVHTHLFGADFWGTRAARQCGIPVVITEHSINAHEGVLKRCVRRFYARYVHQYIAVSTVVAEYLKNICNVQSSVISVIHPGIFVSRFRSVRLPITAPLKFLMIGRLSQEKGFDLGIDALAQVRMYDWECTIVGSGEEKDSLMAQVDEYGLAEKIRFVPALSYVESVYKVADVVIVPSRWEGFGIVSLEALSAGCMVIGTRVGGISNVIEHEKNGILIEPENLVSLVDSLKWALTHVSVVRDMGVYAGEHTQTFDISYMVDAYVDVYKKLI